MSSILKIHIRNCYGIGSFDKEFDLTKGSGIIYAPNGTMKSSLTHVFQDIVSGIDSYDRIYTERISEREVLMDNQPIDAESIYVFKEENVDGYKSVSTFLTNPELKAQYDAIHLELANAKYTLRKNIRNVSGSTDIESEILDSCKVNESDNVYDCFLSLKALVEGDALPLYSFKYNDVFDKKGLVKNFLSENGQIVSQYFEKYNELLSKSNFFSVGENSFGTYQADALISSVKDNRFFKASHKITLKDGSELHDKNLLISRVEQEVQSIFNNEELLSIYQTLEKSLAKNLDLQKFKEAIKNNPAIISKLVDYEGLRKEVIVSYLQQYKQMFIEICDLYTSKRDELRKIVEDANAYTERWKSIIGLFNARFFVPFEARVTNLPDVLLNDKVAALTFAYCDEEGAEPKILEDSKSIRMLSQGEYRAYNIMQNLFVVEGLKGDGKEHLLVLDDVADSFDYKNKYAILEYINDIIQYGCFKVLILTHNFDFYRTAVSRLAITNQFFAYKKPDRTIELGQGIFKTDILKHRIIKKAHKDKAAFISLIPFVRNIIEYTNGDSCDDYLLLTSCLHDKPETNMITIGQLYSCLKSNIKGLEDIEFAGEEKLYIEILNEATQDAISDSNEIEITNKLVLSISIRIKTEKYLNSILTEEQKQGENLNNDPTGKLCKLFKKHYNATKSKECLLVNKVLMLTSENIHLNNFMFEPIVDMPIAHLKALLKEVEEIF